MTGKRVALYFVVFFGFIAAVNGVMMTYAIRTHSGTVTDHPYEKGLAYNKVVEAQEKQEALGWKGTIDYKNGALHFTLHDKSAQLLEWQKAVATITRPTQSGLDFTVELNGTETPVKFPVNGIWNIRIDAVVGDTHFQQSKRIVVE